MNPPSHPPRRRSWYVDGVMMNMECKAYRPTRRPAPQDHFPSFSKFPFRLFGARRSGPGAISRPVLRCPRGPPRGPIGPYLTGVAVGEWVGHAPQSRRRRRSPELAFGIHQGCSHRASRRCNGGGWHPRSQPGRRFVAPPGRSPAADGRPDAARARSVNCPKLTPIVPLKARWKRDALIPQAAAAAVTETRGARLAQHAESRHQAHQTIAAKRVAAR